MRCRQQHEGRGCLQRDGSTDQYAVYGKLEQAHGYDDRPDFAFEPREEHGEREKYACVDVGAVTGTAMGGKRTGRFEANAAAKRT